MNATSVAAPAAATAAIYGRLAHLPVSLFSIVIGLAGTTIALQRAEHLWGWLTSPSSVLLAVTALVFIAISLPYLAKWVLHCQQVTAEFNHPMIPSKLLPTLFILIAPPAVGFISWIQLHHGVVDDAARVFYYYGLLITLLLLVQAKYFMKVSFALPWWAYTFPVAAVTIATSVMLEKVGGSFFAILLPVLLTVLVVGNLRSHRHCHGARPDLRTLVASQTFLFAFVNIAANPLWKRASGYFYA